MMSEVLIRSAAESDIDFIAETIIRAEKGMGNTISYCYLFNLTEEELLEVIRKILLEDIPHFEFSLRSFKIAEVGGIRAGAYAAWIEAAEGIASGFLKTAAFRSFVSREQMQHFRETAAVAETIGISREPGTLQFESIWIREEYRGLGIGNRLVQAQIETLSSEHPGLEKAQVQIIKQNLISLLAHRKYGFQIREEKTSDHPELMRCFSGNTRVLMEIDLRKNG
jgi:ribosomal protein S18 acetylase RimI-like enzyme